MSLPINLFRGDSIPISTSTSKKGQTLVNYFISTGLIAKFSDGGTSNLLENKSLPELVASHIGYETNSPEQDLSFRSPFISFSESIQIAETFATSRIKIKQPTSCTIDQASHFIWELHIENINETSPGIYELSFFADYSNINELLIATEKEIRDDCKNTEVDMHRLGNRIANFLMQTTDLDQQSSTRAPQKAKIINAVKLLENSNFTEYYKPIAIAAISRANRDREWLIHPCTPMSQGFGVSGKFPMNKHLRVKKYYRETI